MAWLCSSPAPRRQDGTVFVAVVGTGISGLAATKCCLGPPSSAEEGRASIYRTIFTNSCEEMMFYSHFPFSDDHPNYMQNARLQYDICKAVHAPLVSEMMDDVDEKMGMYMGKKFEC